MVSKMTGAGVDLCLNIRAFLSFQMVHPTSIVRDAMAFLLGMLLPDMFLHQSERECKLSQVDMSIIWRPSQFLMRFQILRVKRHL